MMATEKLALSKATLCFNTSSRTVTCSKFAQISSADLADFLSLPRMIAVGGSIGTGLFIGSGGALRRLVLWPWHLRHI